MKPPYTQLLVLACCLFPLWPVAAMSDKEIVATINKVVMKVTGGDVAALDDLKTLPSDTTVAAALMFFSQNFYVFRKTKQNGVVAAKTAELATSAPTSEVYLKNMLKKQPVKPNNKMLHQRDTGIDCMVFIHNKVAVRVFGELLSDPELAIPIGTVSTSLADMSLAGAPYSSKTRNDAKTPEAIAKWKEWWEANKAQYAEVPK